jgi:hypothetical protein
MNDDLGFLDTTGDAGQPSEGYFVDHQCSFHYRPSRRDNEPGAITTLANFEARITADIARDDGVSVSRLFEIEGVGCGGRPFPPARVPADRFEDLGWVLPAWGARAVIAPGRDARARLREFIQERSWPVARTVYTHTGWREIDGRWLYLHGDGAIGAGGRVVDVAVDLPGPLAGFRLPNPPEGDALVAAVRASLALLDLAPDRITVPLLGAVYRAALGSADFNVHLSGDTGVMKSELAALAQQHFGAGLDARHLPAAWSSTDNALELLAFHAKDALLVIDDFAPTGSRHDIARLHAKADRVLRAQGNQSGRARLGADSALQATRPPRGLILSTGEDMPQGKSLAGRTLEITVQRGDVDTDRLTEAQHAARDGRLAEALAGFVQWLAGSYADQQRRLRAAVEAYRAGWAGGHARTPENLANLQYGIELLLVFARVVGAIDEDEHQTLRERASNALAEVGEAQTANQRAADPVDRFFALLRGALATGAAYVDDLRGTTPHWFSPQSVCIGWLDGPDLYLEPHAADRVARSLAAQSGEPLALGARTLHKRMAERGLFVSREAGRDGYAIRKSIRGSRVPVLHLRASVLDGTDGQPTLALVA